MRVLIFGATGFIGQELTNKLIGNHNITAVSRSLPKINRIFGDNVNKKEVDYKNTEQISQIISQNDIVVNLAGESIASNVWTKKQKQKMLRSRIRVGNLITKSIEEATNKPTLLIQSSAIGYYGYHTQKNTTEESPKGEGFLAELTKQWENSTKNIELYGVRRAIVRTGIVLGLYGGMLPKLMLPIKYFFGNQLGNGRNYISWIHVTDQIRAIEHIINNNQSKGIYNLTSTEPVQSRELNKIIGKILNRPVWLRAPKYILTLFLGDMAKELLLSDQKVYPDKLLNEGFQFKYENVSDALSSILKQKAT